jgi:hypothetical protein
MEIDETTLSINNFSQKNGSSVTKSGHETAKLVTRVGHGERL